MDTALTPPGHAPRSAGITNRANPTPLSQTATQNSIHSDSLDLLASQQQSYHTFECLQDAILFHKKSWMALTRARMRLLCSWAIMSRASGKSEERSGLLKP